MDFFPEVVQAIPGEGHTVYAYLNDGTVRLVNMDSIIAQGGVFEALLDLNIFREKLTVLNSTVAWDVAGNRDTANCIDIDPIAIYNTAPIVSDPLESETA